MGMFDTLLVPVDGSRHSDRAVATAIEIAREHGSHVVVLHLRQRFPTRAGLIDVDLGDEHLADETARYFKDQGIDARPMTDQTVSGYVAKAIVDTAEDVGAGMIVIGSRGLSDLKGMLLGSTTHRVLHLAKTPVLVVHGNGK